MSSVYIYAVSYDLGFAPNPFGGLLSLANCKPNIRSTAKLGDWIVGLTAVKLKPALRCVFAMVVTGDVSFDDYWANPVYATRKPVRNGSAKSLVGDNIYHRATPQSPWVQENSVHSRVDGTQCPLNTNHDTRINRVLLSSKFVYFGKAAPLVPQEIRDALDYQRNPRGARKFADDEAESLTDWLAPQMAANLNLVVADPLDFAKTDMRFSAAKQKMIR